jgi:23S rRNA A1618 N6-methylase RlmF
MSDNDNSQGSKERISSSLNTVTIQIQQRKNKEKTLRLVLKSADELLKQKYRNLLEKFNIVSVAKFFYTEMDEKIEGGEKDLKNNDLINKNVSEVYIEKLKNKFKKIHDLISEKEKFVRNLMKTMNSEQREEVLVFWEVFSEFFVQLMDAMNKWFGSIVEEIINGKKINRIVLKEIFYF